jgi:hypothetical protein
MTKPKARYFTFLIYPDSAPEGWRTKLEETDMPIAISPLHDKDKREITNEDLMSNLSDEEINLYREGKLYKKEHYHILIVYPNTATADAVRKKMQRALGEEGKKAINKVQIVQKGMESMYKYLTHESKDAVEKKKHKYNANDIMHLNNFDIDRYIVLDVHDKEEMLDVILKAIDENGLENYKQLTRFMQENGNELGIESRKQLTAIIKSNIGMIRLALDGEYQERKREEEKMQIRQKP